MRNSLLVFFFFCTYFLPAQTIFGKWKTVDESGVAKSIVKIYKKDGKVFGDIFRILKESARDKLCTECEGKRKNQKIEGMTIIKNLEKDGNRYEGGTILDPESGKVYKAKIWLNEDNPNILNVRGYIAFLYRTQNWIRVD